VDSKVFQELRAMTCPSSIRTRKPPSSLVLVAIFLLASCAPAVAQVETTPAVQPQAQQKKTEGTLRVTGQAQVSVPADLVRLNFTVETEAESAGEATRNNAERMDAVVHALRGAGLSGLELETFGYDLQPEYETGRNVSNRIIAGYRVRNNLRVTLADVDATGAAMDLAIEAGANRISNLFFEASDTRAAELEALRMAVARAREEAEAMANAMGVQLGIALEVQGGAAAPSPRPPGGFMMRAEAGVPTTPVEAGDQLVSATVTITYRIREQLP
jgi:uncharacterized protein YggE